ncbi:hypothetical protein [Streptomyces sp. NRRL S-337]|uniref:hypothetical protein n=1 Tax=Streptomyces sp. NRRL S-337 TaxID=1463900 RepID=UPI000AEE9411|nr:hypothetical protein [Streptomyces sp. NRRL S-337]
MSTDDRGGFLARLADNTEELQLDIAAELGEHALEVLSDREDWPNELRLLVMDMAGALRDVRRVAISRGHRLPPTVPPECEAGDEGPQLPAASFG